MSNFQTSQDGDNNAQRTIEKEIQKPHQLKKMFSAHSTELAAIVAFGVGVAAGVAGVITFFAHGWRYFKTLFSR
jgi:hypothetical protein